MKVIILDDKGNTIWDIETESAMVSTLDLSTNHHDFWCGSTTGTITIEMIAFWWLNILGTYLVQLLPYRFGMPILDMIVSLQSLSNRLLSYDTKGQFTHFSNN